jgi:uncharacterized membrane protein
MEKETNANKTWHEKHLSKLTSGQRVADKLALGMGSWGFIITQTLLVILWISANIIGIIFRWDPYPFILLNLLFSVQAAYAAPIIMMAQNRQNERDRFQASEDYRTNVEAKQEIEEIKIIVQRIEQEMNLKKN